MMQRCILIPLAVWTRIIRNTATQDSRWSVCRRPIQIRQAASAERAVRDVIAVVTFFVLTPFASVAAVTL